MFDDVIIKSKFMPEYVTRAQAGPIVLPNNNSYLLFGYVGHWLYDAHFDLYGAGNSGGYAYVFRLDPEARHFSPYMFFKDIHKGLRKYDEQSWWEDDWGIQNNLWDYMWQNFEIEVDEDDKSYVTSRGVPEFEIKSLEDLSEAGLEILKLYAGYANISIADAAKRIEHFLELRHSGVGYLPNVHEDAFYSALLDLGYSGLYEWEYESSDYPLNFLILDPSIIESYKVIRIEDVPQNVDANAYLEQQPWIPADFPSPPRRSNPYSQTDVEGYPIEFCPREAYRDNMSEIVTKYKLYRGVPYSGLDLDDLEGRGGYGQQMLGSGLYTTDDYYVAADYANEESARYRDPSKNNTPCVYELELAIPEHQILYIEGQRNTSFCEFGGSAIPSIFGIRSPAFEFWFKDADSGEDFTYLISEDQDPLQYAEDFKLKCANTVLDNHDLGSMYPLEDFDTYLEDLYCEENEGDYEDEDHEFACEGLKTFLAEVAGGDMARAVEILEEEYMELIREESRLPNYGRYDDDEHPNILWGGDSTDLDRLAHNHGFKVLWCSDWISSGDEILIIDDSIYDNGLTIVDDCT